MGPGGPGGPGGMQQPASPEDQVFMLKMRAREIEHQIENLRFELETVRLMMEHVQHQKQGGPRPGDQARPREGGPDGDRGRRGAELKARGEELRRAYAEARERGDKEAMQKIMEKGQELKRQMQELQGDGQPGRMEPERRAQMKMHLQELEKALVQAKEKGNREEAQKLASKMEALRAALGGGDRKPDGNPDERRAKMKARVQELQRALHEAESRGEKDRANGLRKEIEGLMHELTGGAKQNLDEKREVMMKRLRNRASEIEKQMGKAKESGNREAVEKLHAEMQRIHEMMKRVEQGQDPKPQGEKKPRMI